MSYAGTNQLERIRSDEEEFTYNVLGVGTRDTPDASGNRFYWARDDRGKLVSQRLPNQSRHYYLFDGLGSVVAVTDSSGTVGRRYSYDPYGHTTSTGTTSNPWRYAGQYQDPGSTTSNGVYKMGMRYYDPNLGRWTQQDPLEHPTDNRQNNRYSYTGGDPINLTDLSGTHVDFGQCSDNLIPWQDPGEGCLYHHTGGLRDAADDVGDWLEIELTDPTDWWDWWERRRRP